MTLSSTTSRKLGFSSLFAVSVVLCSPLQPSAATPFAEARVKIADKLIKVEVAATADQRNEGLSRRSASSKKYFMLFIFDTPQRVSFWMKDTNRDLSIAFIDENKVIVQIESLTARSLKTVKSRSEQIKYALEVPRGYFGKSNIKIGNKLELIDYVELS